MFTPLYYLKDYAIWLLLKITVIILVCGGFLPEIRTKIHHFEYMHILISPYNFFIAIYTISFMLLFSP